MKAAPLIESNWFCIECGKIGTPWGDRHRATITVIAATVSLLALVLTLIGTLGISRNPAVISQAYWVYGSAFSPNGGLATIFINVNMRLDKVDCGTAADIMACRRRYAALGFQQVHSDLFERTVEWDDADACKNLRHEAACKICKDNLLSTWTLIMAVLTQVSAVTADLQRSTRFGDLNCQATSTRITTFLSFLSGFVALVSFRHACFLALPDDFLGWSQIEWKTGSGFRCLMLATVLKLFDVLCHFLIPTPSARWQKPAAHIKDVEEYMMQAPPSASMG